MIIFLIATATFQCGRYDSENGSAHAQRLKTQYWDSLSRVLENYPDAVFRVVDSIQNLESARSEPDSLIICECLRKKLTLSIQSDPAETALRKWKDFVDGCRQYPEVIEKVYIQKANLLVRTGNYAEAVEELEKSISLSVEIDDTSKWIASVQTLIAMKTDYMDSDSLSYWCDTLEKVAFEFRDSVSIEEALVAQSTVCISNGQYAQGLRYLDRAQTFLPSGNWKREELYILLNRGVAHELMGHPDSAVRYYRQSLEIAESTENTFATIHLLKNLAFLSYDEGQFQTAFDTYERATDMQDSINVVEAQERVVELEARYEAREKEATIQSLKQENRISELQRNFFIVFTFLFLAIATAVVIIYTNRIRSNKLLSEQRIAKLEKEKEVMSLQSMLFAQEEERQRIARDLHDSIGALLSAAKLHLSNIESEIRKLAELDFLKGTEEIIERASSEVRRVSHDMMPGVLMKLGLFEGIEDFFDRIRKNSKLTISFTYDELTKRLDNKHEIMIYRMIQEMVNNTIKHAEASEIKLMIKHDQQNLIIDYRDDGKGFDADKINDPINFGLSGIKSRVRFLQGDVELHSDVTGIHYRIWVPIV
ncbi:MAG: sensor histidine kinase [Flavobacteriales bacterium]